MRVQCPSVESSGVLTHEPCTRDACTWWKKRCTAVDTVPLGLKSKRLECSLSKSCRWSKQSTNGICPPMTHGTLCEHQGGDFNTFDFEEG